MMAASAPLCPFKAAVKPLPCLSLLGYIGMASFTALGLDSLKRGMTLAAVISKISMTEKSAKPLLARIDP